MANLVIKSNTAKRKGIDNTPNSEHLGNLKVYQRAKGLAKGF